jgi:two-component system, NarL family, response regulator DevR
MTKTRILLVDDHEVVRLGLMTLINDQPDMEVIGEAGTTAEAIAAAARLRPDVVLMDIRLPGEGGIEATRQITTSNPNSRVIVVTSFADDELVVRAIWAGASGYVLKQVGNTELLRAIAAVARGEALLDPTTTSKLLARVRESERGVDEDAFKDLSDREMEVLAEVARGKTNVAIGGELGLGEKTVRNYVSTILEKLHRTNRIELATYAVEHHLFDRLGRE